MKKVRKAIKTENGERTQELVEAYKLLMNKKKERVIQLRHNHRIKCEGDDVPDL